MSDVRVALKNTLRGEVGYRRPSSGVSKYGDWFAQKVGDSAYSTGDYCAMGQLWAANQVGLLDLYGGARKEWAWVPSWLDHFRAAGWETSSPGELVLGFMDWNNNGVPNHVLMCMGPASGGEFPTLEFNTDKNGVNGVWEKTRPLSLALAFIKIPFPAPVASDDAWFLGVS